MEVMWSTIPTQERQQGMPLSDSSAQPVIEMIPSQSPYAKLHNLDSIGSSSTLSASLCEELPASDSMIDAAQYLDKALESEEYRPRSVSFISEPQDCRCPVPDTSVCRCSGSLDSGFLSRPSSPFKQAELISDPHYEVLDPTLAFPPPEEFGYGNPFLLFSTLTMIMQHRDTIMEQQMDFNEIIMLFNDSIRKNNVHKILYESRLLYQAYISNNLQPDHSEFEHLP